MILLRGLLWCCIAVVSHGMHIFVKTFTGKTVTLDVAPTDTILSVREKLREKEGYPHPPDSQDFRLLLRAITSLDDFDKTLSDYGIDDETTLHIVGKLKGGGAVMGSMPALFGLQGLQEESGWWCVLS